jgi:hypothetical protein
VLWGLVIFVAFQLVFLTAKETWWPALADPEYGRKLARLRARLSERLPRRPLALILGSSRVDMGFRPGELLVNQLSCEEGPLLFNFGLCQFGPVGELLCLHRLLADGVRPQALLVEIFVPMLAGEENTIEHFDINRLRWPDERLFRRYVRQPGELHARWLDAQIVPSYSHRLLTLNHLAPGWLPSEDRIDIVNWQGMDAWGWVAVPTWERKLQRAQEFAQEELAQQYLVPALSDFHVCAAADRSLRELLSLCRDKGIITGFLLMPEISIFRSWYSARSRAGLESYLTGLRREYGARVVDARTWVADEEFVEGIHLTYAGARTFTQCFERQVLPLLVLDLFGRMGIDDQAFEGEHPAKPGNEGKEDAPPNLKREAPPSIGFPLFFSVRQQEPEENNQAGRHQRRENANDPW